MYKRYTGNVTDILTAIVYDTEEWSPSNNRYDSMSCRRFGGMQRKCMGTSKCKEGYAGWLRQEECNLWQQINCFLLRR